MPRSARVAACRRRGPASLPGRSSARPPRAATPVEDPCALQWHHDIFEHVSELNSAPIWNSTPTVAAAERAASPTPSSSSLNRRMEPPDGASSMMISRSRVVLPDPSRHQGATSPRATSRSSPSCTSRLPKRVLRPRISMTLSALTSPRNRSSPPGWVDDDHEEESTARRSPWSGADAVRAAAQLLKPWKLPTGR